VFQDLIPLDSLPLVLPLLFLVLPLFSLTCI